jgi:protocatechuate 3,4-dioxygenase beta subunit
MRFAPLFLFLPAMLWAQQSGTGTSVAGPAVQSAAAATAPSAETKPEDKCGLQGKVVSATTGEAVKKATILLRRTDLNPTTGVMPMTYTTTSDPGGKFAMKDIDPGKYRLSVMRTGFVTAEYGSRGAMRSGTTLSLEPGKQLTDVNFKLTPHGVITGRVLDDDGEPVAMVQIQVLSYRYNQGRKQLLPIGSASTNDLGEYRVFGISPGKCFLSATYRPSGFFEATLDRSSAAQPDEDYVPTYYPGSTDPAAAATVEVLPGAQLQGLDIRLSKTKTVRVRGQVKNLSGGGRQNIAVMLMPRDRMGFYYNMNRTMVRDAQGEFELRGVAPGAYSIVATLYDGDKSLSARAPLDVGSSHVENVVLLLSPGKELNGRIRVDGQTAVSLTDIRLNLRPYDSSGVMFGPMPTGRVKEDGSFTLSNVGPDRYRLFAYNLPDGYYLKSVQFGNEDALEAPLDLTSGGAGSLDVALGANAGQVEGNVMSPKGESAPGATVVLIPQSPKRRDQSALYKTVTSDQYGHFQIKNVDPGEYKAYAWEDVELGAYMDPDFVKPVENRGQALGIHEGSHENIQLDLIPAESGSQAKAATQ